MNLFNDMMLKFENPYWSKNPEFGLIDTILEIHPEIYNIFKSDLIGDEDIVDFGCKDTPSVEQIVRQQFTKN